MYDNTLSSRQLEAYGSLQYREDPGGINCVDGYAGITGYSWGYAT